MVKGEYLLCNDKGSFNGCHQCSNGTSGAYTLPSHSQLSPESWLYGTWPGVQKEIHLVHDFIGNHPCTRLCGLGCKQENRHGIYLIRCIPSHRPDPEWTSRLSNGRYLHICYHRRPRHRQRRLQPRLRRLQQAPKRPLRSWELTLK